MEQDYWISHFYYLILHHHQKKKEKYETLFLEGGFDLYNVKSIIIQIFELLM